MWREPAEQLPQTMISSNVLPAMLISHSKPVWGERVEKPSQWPTGFSIFWRIQEKTKAKPFQALSFRCYTKSIITAHAPGPHIWPSLGPGPDSKCSKTVLRVTCQREIVTDEIRGIDTRTFLEIRVRLACQLSVSMPRKMAGDCREFQHPSGIEPMSLDSKSLKPVLSYS